jgi:hypothetical protein
MALKRESEAEFAPIARYYLEKLGKPVPETQKTDAITPVQPTPGITEPAAAKPAGTVEPATPKKEETAKPKS